MVGTVAGLQCAVCAALSASSKLPPAPPTPRPSSPQPSPRPTCCRRLDLNLAKRSRLVRNESSVSWLCGEVGSEGCSSGVSSRGGVDHLQCAMCPPAAARLETTHPASTHCRRPPYLALLKGLRHRQQQLVRLLAPPPKLVLAPAAQQLEVGPPKGEPDGEVWVGASKEAWSQQ